MQGKGVQGELLTDEVEGPLTPQKKMEEEKWEEAGGISSHSLLFFFVTCLVVPLCSSLLPHAWQALDLFHKMAMLLLTPGEASQCATVSSIRALLLHLR